MSQSWKDNRLIIPDDIVFNVNTSNDPRGPYRLLPLTFIDKIWRPDSFFKNAKEVTFQEMTIPNHYIWLYSDNTILYMVKLTLLLSCAMKFQTYPHDTQNCTMKIESLSYTTKDLVFDWEESDPLVVEEHIELPQHDLINKDIDYCTTDYSSGTFACVQVVFTIKRRIGYYIFHTYIPTCLIVIMSWISFWIKPEAVPARVTLCVTSLLTLSTQHAQSQKSLPPVSYIKAIDIFMSSCTVFVFASLMEYALVNILMADELLNGWIGIAPTAYQQQQQPQQPQPQPSTTTKTNHMIDSKQTKIQPKMHDASTMMFHNNNNDHNHQNKVPNHISTATTTTFNQHYHHHHHPVRCRSLTRLDNLEFNQTISDSNYNHNQVNNKSSIRQPSSSTILRHRCCTIFNNENKINESMKCTMNEDDDDEEEEDVFLDSDNPMKNCRQRRQQQQQTNDRKQSFIYAFPTPSIYDDQNFCYRSWRLPPFQQTTTTGVNRNYEDGDGYDNFNNNNNNNNNNNYNNKQYLLQTKHKRAYTVDYISRYIFPISFIVLNIIYWTYYLEVLVTLS
uniref:Gamma-aminobutyric acid receptor subunit alpha-1-like isoform X1 n=1 Tax=Dermatophagoides pteronyssinus TaxID=6956 RepID=A0A6P6YGV7_DERPT|nr:gamma-aminobutyric acid receptor subunit alpha-1-like isoform X1 [Dermatophagoides pteronyssinus]